ncbi:hypothetical protein ACFXGG_23725 [Streptomyces nigra]|uniref:hypothetical protein n=1 Tax=Streptomyces nigra TaxID=1827580 RepID=UPI0036852761
MAEHVHAELGELIVGDKPGRTAPDQITLYNPVGVGVQDAAATALVVASARERSVDERGQTAVGSEAAVADLGVYPPKEFRQRTPDDVLGGFGFRLRDRRKQRLVRNVSEVGRHLLGLRLEHDHPVAAGADRLAPNVLQMSRAEVFLDPRAWDRCHVEPSARVPRASTQHVDQCVVALNSTGSEGSS